MDKEIKPYLLANAICFDCGTAKENPDNGYCLNNHDNWIEQSDTDLMVKFSKKNKIKVEVVLESILQNKCVKIIKT